MPSFYQYSLDVQVPNTVVARGVVIDSDRRAAIEAAIAEVLEAYDDEGVRVLVRKEPDPKAIEREQR
jgi:hypothetical protein